MLIQSCDFAEAKSNERQHNQREIKEINEGPVSDVQDEASETRQVVGLGVAVVIVVVETVRTDARARELGSETSSFAGGGARGKSRGRRPEKPEAAPPEPGRRAVVAEKQVFRLQCGGGGGGHSIAVEEELHASLSRGELSHCRSRRALPRRPRSSLEREKATGLVSFLDERLHSRPYQSTVVISRSLRLHGHVCITMSPSPRHPPSCFLQAV